MNINIRAKQEYAKNNLEKRDKEKKIVYAKDKISASCHSSYNCKGLLWNGSGCQSVDAYYLYVDIYSASKKDDIVVSSANMSE